MKQDCNDMKIAFPRKGHPLIDELIARSRSVGQRAAEADESIAVKVTFLTHSLPAELCQYLDPARAFMRTT
jgi:hypothetical protein